MRKNKITERKILNIAKRCAEKIHEKKGEDILLLDLRKVHNYLDYFLIVTGNSLLHCRALAREVQRFMQEVGFPERIRPRLDSGWIVLDYNEIVVHVFTKELRDHYQLEYLWADSKRIEWKCAGDS
ncbi:MAG: ribosome silencing factor [Spirochaetes bacterium]|nr:ribosome silencing factor [Spirochaetota bacterium]